MDKKVFDFLRDKFSLVLGESIYTTNQRKLDFSIEGMTFRILPGIDVVGDNKISFISIQFFTEDKSEMIEALNKLKKFFDLNRIPT